ncbi:hypothetical protein METSCH_C04610 [Metschnikowia aff. pulcherrima]|uniref:I-AAA protease complex subunit Mgr1 n=1 Tax=Metschnikowia aff. pulcherrima TaxID=2163413 RepID=A0A4V1AEA1_9ASCO|nr:hypothetical protein METSCH_C04610 [Metschnikowia aff. pulcherrima]
MRYPENVQSYRAFGDAMQHQALGVYKRTSFSIKTVIEASYPLRMVLETKPAYFNYLNHTTRCADVSLSMNKAPTRTRTSGIALKPWHLSVFPSGNPIAGGNGSGSTGDGRNSTSSPGGNLPPPFLLFPRNPNLGLFLLAPIVPAPDNRPALALLTAVQLLLGLSLMTKRKPKIGESRFRHRSSLALRFLTGSVLVFLSGFEALRLSIPYDPWADEARVWRQWATKNGHKPSWWYGGIAYYTPMLITEWKVKTTTWISNTINILEDRHRKELAEEQEKDSELLSSIPLGLRAVLKAGEANTYNDIYENLFLKSCKRSRELLTGELKNVTELNKAERLDALMEHQGESSLNEDYIKPNIQLGTHTMETDDEFELVWANFEPWDELRQETDYDVRLIPRWRCLDELPEH